MAGERTRAKLLHNGVLEVADATLDVCGLHGQ